MGTVDEVCGAASLGDAAVVFAVVVVVIQVAAEFAFEAAVADLKKPREGRSPALLEDRAVQAFDVSVGLRAPGVDARVADVEALQRGGEREAAELVAVV